MITAVVVAVAIATDVGLQHVLARPEPITVEHAWPADLSGPVWVVVDPEGERGRLVTFRWGPWRTEGVLENGEATAFLLSKSATTEAASVPIAITVDAAADVSFGVGAAPVGLPAEPLDGDWQGPGLRP